MLQFLFTRTPLAYLLQNFWRDEAYSYLLAEKPILEILALTARDFNPPLYYVLLHFWIMISGRNEIFIRLLSFVPYLGMIFVAHLCVLTFCRKHRIYESLYILFFATVPIFMYYSFEARMYSFLAFFTLLSSYAFLTKKNKLYLVSAIGGLYTHYFMLFVIATQFLFVIVNNKKKFSLDEYKYPLIALGGFLPWVIFVITARTSGDGSFWIPFPTTRDYMTLLGSLYTGYERNFTFFSEHIMKVSLLLLGSFCVGLMMIKKDIKLKSSPFFYFMLLTVIPIIIVAALSFVRPLVLPRYLIVSSVGLAMTLILLADRLPKYLRIGFITLLIVVSVLYIKAEVKNRIKIFPARTIREIRSIADKNDLLYVRNELDYFPAQFYFGNENVYIYKKQYDDIPNYVGKVLIPRERIVESLPYYPQKAFIIGLGSSSYRVEALY